MSRLKKSDWYGLGASVLLHGVLIVLFALMTIGASEEASFGYMEVEFGPIAEGRPVQRTPEPAPAEEAPRQEREQEMEPEPQAALPETAKPVDLPDQTDEVVDEDVVTTPDTETISPETRSETADVEEPEPRPEQETIQPLGGGSPEGTAGQASGEQGLGSDEEKSAPYQIEGLNRRLVSGPLPAYAEQPTVTLHNRPFAEYVEVGVSWVPPRRQ